MSTEQSESCSPSAPTSTLTVTQAADLARVLKAVADPNRLRLVSIIRANGATCACDLNEPVGLNQSTVSHHLSVLTKTGWLNREQRGIWAWFEINPARIDQIDQLLETTPTSKASPALIS